MSITNEVLKFFNTDNVCVENKIYELPAIIFLSGICIIYTMFCLMWPAYGSYDSFGLYNISYMTKETLYPSYPLLTNPGMAVAHPPTLYYILGLEEYIGLTAIISQRLTAVILYSFTIFALGSGRFSFTIKLSFAAALFSISLLTMDYFHCRPDIYFLLAWTAGMLWLENSRLDNWNSWKAFLGTTLLTLGAVFHYPYHFAVLSIIPYYTFCYFAGNNRRKYLLAMTSGMLLIGIPYLYFVFVPYFMQIKQQISVSGRTGGIITCILEHFNVYNQYAQYFSAGWTWSFLPVTKILAVGLPASVFSLLLLIPKSTRFYAFAIQPLLWLTFLMVNVKFCYILPDLFIWQALVLILVLTPIIKLFKYLKPKSQSFAIYFISFLLLLITFTGGNIYQSKIDNMGFYPEKMEVLRRCSKEMIDKQNYRIAGGSYAWYTSGADKWLNIMESLVWCNSLPLNADMKKEFYNFFDGLIINWYTSSILNTANASSNGKHSFTKLYIDHKFKIRNFVFLTGNYNLCLLKPDAFFLSYSDLWFMMHGFLTVSSDVDKLQGYIILNNNNTLKLYENAHGRYIFYSVLIPINETDCLKSFLEKTLGGILVDSFDNDFKMVKLLSGIMEYENFNIISNTPHAKLIDSIRMNAEIKSIQEVFNKTDNKIGKVKIYNSLAQARSDYYSEQIKNKVVETTNLYVDWENNKIINSENESRLQLNKFKPHGGFTARIKNNNRNEYLKIKSNLDRWGNGVELPALSVENSGIYLFFIEYTIIKNGEMAFIPVLSSGKSTSGSTRSLIWDGWPTGEITSDGKQKMLLAAEFYLEKDIPFTLQFKNDAYFYYYPSEIEIYSIKPYFLGNRKTNY